MLIVAGAFGIWGTLRDEQPERRAHAAMHLVSVPLAMIGGWAVTFAVRDWPGYFVAGFLAALLYEMLLSVEIVVALTGAATGGSARRDDSGWSD
jgi:uncharacterized membrane protein YfcA